jgi:carbon-monoxide dehydrogenase small subunit
VKRELELKVNGEEYTVEVEPHRTLLEVIRNDLGLTGTKLGCGGGECGACTVILDGKAVKSCLMLALDAKGKEILTIEGLTRGEELHPLQRAFVERGAIQCGFCTPGMIMASKALLDENPHPSEQEIKDALAGNLCRCTGYVKILEAIKKYVEDYARQPVAESTPYGKVQG